MIGDDSLRPGVMGMFYAFVMYLIIYMGDLKDSEVQVPPKIVKDFRNLKGEFEKCIAEGDQDPMYQQYRDMTMVLWRVADSLFSYALNYKKFPIDKMMSWAKHTEVTLTSIGIHHAS